MSPLRAKPLRTHGTGSAAEERAVRVCPARHASPPPGNEEGRRLKAKAEVLKAETLKLKRGGGEAGGRGIVAKMRNTECRMQNGNEGTKTEIRTFNERTEPDKKGQLVGFIEHRTLNLGKAEGRATGG